jgi:predicted nucleotidyltransferase component of viral defense system
LGAQNNDAIMNFIDLPTQKRLDIFRRTQAITGMSQQIIEKDWWVTAVLRALFSLSYAENLSFKGGTSLSKCWG